MRAAIVLALLIVATPAHAWQPPSGGPSKMAKRILDSLPEPSKVAVPHEVEERSRQRMISDLPVSDTTFGVIGSHGSLPRPDGCWEVQLTAVSDANRARDMAAQESARLGVRVHVVVENGLSKVRAGGDCTSYDQATDLRDRVRPDYPGAFVIRTLAGGSGS